MTATPDEGANLLYYSREKQLERFRGRVAFLLHLKRQDKATADDLAELADLTSCME